MIELKLVPSEKLEEEKGCYATAVTDDGRRIAIFSCPECGNIASLSEHSIAEDGTVSPSVVHSRDGCNFHDWIKLLDWPGQPQGNS